MFLLKFLLKKDLSRDYNAASMSIKQVIYVKIGVTDPEVDRVYLPSSHPPTHYYTNSMDSCARQSRDGQPQLQYTLYFELNISTEHVHLLVIKEVAR